MKEGRIIEPSKIHIVNIKTIKGNIDALKDADTSAVASHTFEFELGIGVRTEDKVIGIELTVTIEAHDSHDQKLNISGAYTHEIVFEIENLDDFIDFKEGVEQPLVDRLMMGTLIGIAYSTIRGIIFSRTQSTSLSVVVLPVLDPKKLIPDEETAASNE